MSDQSKERDVKIGLANNLFGAAAGGVATAQAGVAARGAWKNRNLSPDQQKKAAEKAKDAPGRARKVFRKLPAGVQKPVRAAAKSRWTVPGLAVGNVGMQLANGGMDGQSAQYFGRELRDMKREEKAVKKSQSFTEFYESPSPRGDGVGRNLNDPPVVEVSKEILYAAPKEANPRRKRNNTAAAALGVGAAGAATYSGKQFRDLNRQIGEGRRSETRRVVETKSNLHPVASKYKPASTQAEAGRRLVEAQRLKPAGKPQPRRKRVTWQETAHQPVSDSAVDRPNPVQGIKNEARALLQKPKDSDGNTRESVKRLYRQPGVNMTDKIERHSKLRSRGTKSAVAALGLAGAATAAHKIGGSKERNRWT